MNIGLSLERRVRVAALHADLTRNVKQMDALGLELAANHLDHAIAIIEAEVCPDATVTDAVTLSETMLAHAHDCVA